jgi:DNA-binding XRE family transcriptional regulator
MTMTKAKRKKLEAKGWKIGSAEDFLGLSAEEAIYVQVKLAFSDLLRKLREDQKLTQTVAAQRIHSSQSRVAKMEAGDPSVSMDLLFRSLLALGASNQDLAKVIRSSSG